MRRKMLPVLALATLALGAVAPRTSGCDIGPYIIFFEWSSSALKKPAVEVVDKAIEASDVCGPAGIMLAGHIDDSEDHRYSALRLKAVSNYFASRGVFIGRRYLQDFRNKQQRVATARGVKEPQNRRVEITFGLPGL